MARTIKLRIEGMHCESCEKIITMELQEIPGVESAKINSQTGAGLVMVREEVSDAQIIAAVVKAGYQSRIVGQ